VCGGATINHPVGSVELPDAHPISITSANAAAWRGFIAKRVSLRLLAFQPNIVAREAGCVDRARFAQCGVIFLEALELARLVECDRILLVVLKVGQCLLAIVLSVETGDDNPARNRRVGIDIMRDLGLIGRHHQIPADEGKRREVAAFQVSHAASYTDLAAKSHRGACR
jgi:hypothetical protein